MNKKGVELAFNAIIISILALLVLGVMILFFTGMFGEIIDRWPSLDIDPTPTDPIVFAPLEVRVGRETKMTIAFYNDESAEVPASVKPQMVCNDIGQIGVNAAGMNIAPGEIGKYSTLISVPEGTLPDTYPCTITISETQETFFIAVK